MRLTLRFRVLKLISLFHAGENYSDTRGDLKEMLYHLSCDEEQILIDNSILRTQCEPVYFFSRHKNLEMTAAFTTIICAVCFPVNYEFERGRLYACKFRYDFTRNFRLIASKQVL